MIKQVMHMAKNINIFRIAVAMLTLLPLWSCDKHELSDDGGKTSAVPEGMVEVRPMLPGMYNPIPRDVSGGRSVASRKYDKNEDTELSLENNPLLRLSKGSTIWLIAENTSDDPTAAKYVKKSYVVYNPEDDATMSYLVPCTVNDKGEMLSMQGSPLYLKDGSTYLFYAISPARKLWDLSELDKDLFQKGQMGFRVKNGEYFYANDCRYKQTTPAPVTVQSDNSEAVQIIKLSPMINQTAELKFQIKKGIGVHNLDIQPSGIQISGLQDDSPDGLYWHMSQTKEDEPIKLQHGNKAGTYNDYDYTIDSLGRVNIEVPILPMYSLSKPVIVVFRLKVNGVPSSYEMMLNEKDFKAGYSYGYRGIVNIEKGVSVITWQYVSWEYDIEWPLDKI